jgi:ubiquinone/menaquinone biosynthesis C-methylase UbiE
MLSDPVYRLKEIVFKRLPFIENVFAFNRSSRDRWIASEASRLLPGLKVLDVGAGSCPHRPLFARCEYLAHDLAALAPGQLQGRKGYGSLDLISRIDSLPIASETFDVVLCTEVLEHVPEPIQAIQEIARIIHRGGLLLLTAPLRSGIHQEPYHFYGGYTPFWYSKFLTEAGFEEITITPVGGLFKMYGESSLHVAFAIAPWSLKDKSVAVRLLLFPVWLVSLPWLAVLCPLFCHILDRVVFVEWGTVGYHVRAIKG